MTAWNSFFCHRCNAHVQVFQIMPETRTPEMPLDATEACERCWSTDLTCTDDLFDESEDDDLVFPY